MEGPERPLVTILLPGQVHKIRECLQVLICLDYPLTESKTVVEIAKKINGLLQ